MQCRRKCAKTIGDRMSKLFPSVDMDFIISIIFNHISWVTLLSQMDESVIKCCIWQLHIPHPIMFQKVKKCSPCQVVHMGPHQDRYIIAECSDMVDLYLYNLCIVLYPHSICAKRRPHWHHVKFLTMAIHLHSFSLTNGNEILISTYSLYQQSATSAYVQIWPTNFSTDHPLSLTELAAVVSPCRFC